MSLYSVSYAVDLMIDLQLPATSTRLSSHSSAAPAITLVHSNLDEIVSLQSYTQCWLTFLQSRPTPALPISHSSPSTSTSITYRLRQLSSWWPPHTGHSLPPIVNVPLAQGQEVRSIEFRHGHGNSESDSFISSATLQPVLLEVMMATDATKSSIPVHCHRTLNLNELLHQPR
jgi:hypothetical protein